MIDFYLNGKRRQCADVSPDTSILELLRTQLGQTGTKEGCASGDCGACTVAIGEPDVSGELRYHNANACITPAYQLQGCHLVTVEGLSRGDALHPAQAAMVECHGSQCGFCTPGIVMSLFTLHEEQRRCPAPLTQERLEAALGGNLCRCTGYRPIRDAALSMDQYPDTHPVWADDPELAANIVTLRQNTATTSEFASQGHFTAPRDLAALRELKRQRPQARLVAGATDLWLETTQQLRILDDLIDVRQVAELNTIEETPEGWWIGSAVTYSRLEPLLEVHYPTFAHLMHRFASSQIRNRGTLGGNVANASPIGDTPPVLLALDARLILDGPDGERELPLAEFFLDYKKTALKDNEFIRAIFLPRPSCDQNLKVWKLSKRREDDISAVLAAFAWRQEDGVMRDVRLAFGGMAAIPRRALGAEQALEGQPPCVKAFEAAKRSLRDEFQPMTDVRGAAEYRQMAASNMLERLHLMLVAASNQNTDAEVMLDAYAH
ncbi:molybdopterin dehydrogenase [Litchfieldella anticariensis FP35 = DSM 16096]|uniref:Molybdopterin dehydrogenase n=1 Tax=Litchfieldella anticariensis (strain DSM 16096 / CECT 5854 / CIP 108499 / LMG 22089 / FP35) TaxID=1121939 RepID=S2LI28_LITA3|nr:xanthine dehydrogenase small subunit [Halomonas anticariensis]EPC04301.1 molybdopterin dehydrogenase [Halomonas anticariensis FP35 = DSM 16096]